jgi:uncharacterized protein (DUF433 family)
MAQATTVDIGTLITKTPGVYGGRPCLAGTRFPILEIAVQYNAGVSPEELAEDFSLALDKVYAGYAYYLANKKAIDDDLAAERAEWEAGKREQDRRIGSLPP